jgi:asparagine synthase (glutamine-hydrolysing)
VALSGEGGDELFGGYVRYSGAWLAGYYRKLPRFITRDLSPRLSSLWNDDTEGRHGFRRLREFSESAWKPLDEMYLSWVGYFSESEKQALYSADFASRVSGYDSGIFMRDLFSRSARLDPMNRLGYVDLASFLACNCLEYSDRMSMANSLEVRCPFTDQNLIEFALHLPYSFKFHRFQTKWVVKEAMRGILPEAILRKKKVGFNPPLPIWINNQLKPLVEQLLSPASIKRRGIFQPDAVARLLRDHTQKKRDNALKIWALLMLEVWQRMYLENESESSILDTFALTAAAVE